MCGTGKKERENEEKVGRERVIGEEIEKGKGMSEKQNGGMEDGKEKGRKGGTIMFQGVGKYAKEFREEEARRNRMGRGGESTIKKKYYNMLYMLEREIAVTEKCQTGWDWA